MEYERLFRERLDASKTEFSKSHLRKLADYYLESRDPTLSEEYISSPVQIYKREFEKLWVRFEEENRHRFLSVYREACAPLNMVQDYLKTIATSLGQQMVQDFEFDSPQNHDLILGGIDLCGQSKWFANLIETGCNTSVEVNGITFRPKFKLAAFHTPKDRKAKLIMQTIMGNILEVTDYRWMLGELIRRLDKIQDEFKTYDSKKLPNLQLKAKTMQKAIGCQVRCPMCDRICDSDNHGQKPGSRADPHHLK